MALLLKIGYFNTFIKWEAYVAYQDLPGFYYTFLKSWILEVHSSFVSSLEWSVYQTNIWNVTGSFRKHL